MSASPQDLMTAKLFFNAAFPTMQVLLDDDPKLHKKFQNFNATVQFGAMNDGELLCCHLIFHRSSGPGRKKRHFSHFLLSREDELPFEGRSLAALHKGQLKSPSQRVVHTHGFEDNDQAQR